MIQHLIVNTMQKLLKLLKIQKNRTLSKQSTRNVLFFWSATVFTLGGSSMARTTSLIMAAQARRSCARSTDSFSQSWFHRLRRKGRSTRSPQGNVRTRNKKLQEMATESTGVLTARTCTGEWSAIQFVPVQTSRKATDHQENGGRKIYGGTGKSENGSTASCGIPPGAPRPYPDCGLSACVPLGAQSRPRLDHHRSPLQLHQVACGVIWMMRWGDWEEVVQTLYLRSSGTWHKGILHVTGTRCCTARTNALLSQTSPTSQVPLYASLIRPL
ncbi:uncharacterized protein LOC127593081 [Hippocampus zosterae]|uniref:uncharacterized protein LOC127593081 n=1 Tax=Hippocampus zosterae TaxID=109293 RepID=UPI00223E3697|nr:uncharacterized protein LOC127593081 [Hippocampus zosterae]